VLMVTMRICSWASAWPSEPTARLGFCLTCGTISRSVQELRVCEEEVSYAAALAAIMLLLQPKEQPRAEAAASKLPTSRLKMMRVMRAGQGKQD
ncbi:unnamed protein product, partial [Effrenium voratum]